MGEKDKRHFSIANAPLSDLIELHIGATPENSYAMQVIEKMQLDGEILAEVGNGEAYLRENSQPTNYINGRWNRFLLCEIDIGANCSV